MRFLSKARVSFLVSKNQRLQRHQLIRRVDVYCGYQLNITFNFDLTPYIEGDDTTACWKNGRKTFLFENGVKSKVGGCIGTACKNLKTVQAKQCSPQKPASAKRKAPYFLRSTVLFWWRIAGSNRWPLACHASALPAELIPHKIQEANLLDGVFCWEFECRRTIWLGVCFDTNRAPEPRTHAPPRKGARMNDI